MYDVSAQGIDERMINVHCYYFIPPALDNWALTGWSQEGHVWLQLTGWLLTRGSFLPVKHQCIVTGHAESNYTTFSPAFNLPNLLAS